MRGGHKTCLRGQTSPPPSPGRGGRQRCAGHGSPAPVREGGRGEVNQARFQPQARQSDGGRAASWYRLSIELRLRRERSREAMLTRVGTITVQVRDQDQALAYYTEKLGFEPRMDVPMGPDQRWVEVAPVGAQTRILL